MRRIAVDLAKSVYQVAESVHAGEISIHHIEGKRNCADIFTKELKDASHFCRLRDSFMMDRSTFSLIPITPESA